MAYRKIILKNTLFLGAAECAGKVVSFFWTIYLARVLGTLIFGRYNIINSLVGLFLFLPDLGTNIIAIRQIAQNKKVASRILPILLVINLFFASLAFLLLLTIGRFYPFWPEMLLPLSLAAFTLVLSSLRTVAIVTFQGFEKMDYAAVFGFFNILASVFFGFLSLKLWASLSGLFTAVMIATGLMGVFAWLVVLKKFTSLKIFFDFGKIKALLQEGFPLGLAALFALLYSKIDTLILARLLGEAAAGIYGAVVVLVIGSIQLFNVPLVAAAFPTLSRLFGENFQEFKGLIKSLMLVVVGWSLPLILAIWFFHEELIRLFYGSEYQPAGLLLKNLIFIVPLASWSAILYKVLVVIGRQSVYLWISLGGSIVNILANLVLIPVMGMSGAVLANLLTYLILFLFYVYFTQRYLKA